jgi:serine protease
MATRQIEQLGIEGVWETSRGAGVRVAVLDCGVITSPALPPGRVEGVSASGGLEDATSDAHGTSCASLIASEEPDACGLAPEASLLSVQVMTARDSLAAVDVTRGLERALEQGCHVISCSFTLSRFGAQQKRIASLVRQAHLRGIPVIAAHGNTPGEPAPFPEAVQHAIVVSAHDQAFEVMRVNHNHWTDIFALGDEVDIVNGDGLARTWVGNTSGATAIVAGAVALALAAVDEAKRARLGTAMDGLLKASALPLGTGAHGLPRFRLNVPALVESALAF